MVGSRPPKFVDDRVSGICWKCTEKEFGPDFVQKGNTCRRIFVLTRAFHRGRGGRMEVIDAFRCETCGEVVPFDTFNRYQITRDIVVKKGK